FYIDEEYEKSCEKIQKAIINIIDKSEKYDELVFPENGFGTGLALLPEKAPKTFDYLNAVILECFGVDYADIIKNGIQFTINPSEVDKIDNLRKGLNQDKS